MSIQSRGRSIPLYIIPRGGGRKKKVRHQRTEKNGSKKKKKSFISGGGFPLPAGRTSEGRTGKKKGRKKKKISSTDPREKLVDLGEKGGLPMYGRGGVGKRGEFCWRESCGEEAQEKKIWSEEGVSILFGRKALSGKKKR